MVCCKTKLKETEMAISCSWLVRVVDTVEFPFPDRKMEEIHGVLENMAG